MNKKSDSHQDKNEIKIVMFITNKVNSKNLDWMKYHQDGNNIENIQEMDDLNDIIINSEPGYIKDIKQECQKLSIEEIRTKIVSELTGEDIK